MVTTMMVFDHGLVKDGGDGEGHDRIMPSR